MTWDTQLNWHSSDSVGVGRIARSYLCITEERWADGEGVDLCLPSVIINMPGWVSEVAQYVNAEMYPLRHLLYQFMGSLTSPCTSEQNL